MITALSYSRKRIINDQKFHSEITVGLDRSWCKKFCPMKIILYGEIIQTRLKYCIGFALKSSSPINCLRTISENSRCSLTKKFLFRKTIYIPERRKQTLVRSYLHEDTILFRLACRMANDRAQLNRIQMTHTRMK